MKSLKIFALFAVLICTASSLFAQNQYPALSLWYDGDVTTGSAPAGAVQVNAVYSKFPAMTGSSQTLNYPIPGGTQTITPPFAPAGTTYRLESLTFTWNGMTTTVNNPQQNGSGGQFGNTNWLVLVFNDNNGHYRYQIGF
jgi:hypothetical protein